MDAGTAAIIAASVSTTVGGTLGFLSSYFTTRLSMRHTRKSTALPRQMDAAQFVAMVLFRTLSGEDLDRRVWDEFIASCYWLPQNVRSKCLMVLSRKERESVLEAQGAVIEFCNTIVKGE